MTLQQFLNRLNDAPETIEFDECMSVVDANYTFTPTAFENGDVSNAANENNGSCKVFAFAQLNELSADQTLACFGGYYRHDVLDHPDAQDHANIRSFMKHGWVGIQFVEVPLVPVQ